MFTNPLEMIEKRKIEELDISNEGLTQFDVLRRINSELLKTHKSLVQRVTEKSVSIETLHTAVEKIIRINNFSVPGLSMEELKKSVLDHIFKYGLIQKYLDDPECNGVFINGPNNIWVQIGSKRVQTGIRFGNKENLLDYIQLVVNSCEATLNKDEAISRFVDPVNKIRFVAAIEPVAYMNPWVVFRKHRDEAFKLNELVHLGMLTSEMADYLKSLQNANIIFTGKGAAGKTTLMRALLEENDSSIRIMPIEESEELHLNHPNAVSCLVKRNKHGHIINMQEIVDHGQMSTIDKYVFGEIRGSESMVFFDGAFNGNITWCTGHALSARKAPLKMMINMKKSGTTLDRITLLEMLHESLDVIVHMDRFRAAEIVEVLPYNQQESPFNTLYRFEASSKMQTFMEGEFVKVGEIMQDELKDKVKEVRRVHEGDTTFAAYTQCDGEPAG